MTGETDPDARSEESFGSIGIGPIRRAGYNILTWDARGFGGSGGEVDLHDPKVGGRDGQALLDHVARQPEAQLDAPGDPRAGMSGSSYGGIIQVVLAAIDRRVDAIAPSITPNSYLTALYPDQTVKAGWGAILSGVSATSIPLGAFSPAGPQLGNLDRRIYRGLAEGVATGKFSPEIVRFFDERGPRRVVARVRVPTLFMEGLADTLFPVDEATRNQAAVARNGAPTKTMWFCGGHGLCTGDNGPNGRLEAATIRWLDRWVKRDASVDTGPKFEWLADNEDAWRTAKRFPPRAGTRLRGTESGLLPLTPASPATGGGALIAATPALDAVNVAIEPPAKELPQPNAAARAVGAVDVLGAPRVKLTYSGTATPPKTYLFAQVVDGGTGRVVGNQVTPIPVTLDGRRRSVLRDLEPVATRAGPGSRYRVQVAAGSTVYGLQRSAGVANLERVDASLPVVASAATSEGAASGGAVTEPAAEDQPAARKAGSGEDAASELGGSGGDGDGLPVTGLELLALTILGAAMLSTGLVLRRRRLP
ncbi:MAG: peptidase S15 [Thermoleophilaceae bacterium]|nr:peptidase S15 [Thermoleophilaceae bacterium]